MRSVTGVLRTFPFQVVGQCRRSIGREGDRPLRLALPLHARDGGPACRWQLRRRTGLHLVDVQLHQFLAAQAVLHTARCPFLAP